MIKKKPFIKYNLEDNQSNVISLKLNPREAEIVAIGAYCFNMHSRGGVLKELAEMGLKVILNGLGMEKWHKLTRGDRRRLIHDKPILKHFNEKGNG